MTDNPDDQCRDGERDRGNKTAEKAGKVDNDDDDANDNEVPGDSTLDPDAPAMSLLRPWMDAVEPNEPA